MMKLLSLLLLSLAVAGVVISAEPATATTPTTSTTPATPTTTPATPTAEDPIIQDYIKHATELYEKAIIDYYHAHPERLVADLSLLSTAEYETLLPPNLITEFHLNRDEIEKQLRANDVAAYQTAETENDMEINAIPSQTLEDRLNPHQFDAQIGKAGLGLYGGGLGFGGVGLGVGGVGLGYPILGGGFGWEGAGLGLGYPGVGLGIGYPLGGVGLGLGYRGLGGLGLGVI